MHELVVPEIGESVTTGILAAWLKNDGDQVSEGEELFELETDKATLAVPSPGTGVLRVTVQEGAEVEVGQVVASIEEGPASPAAAEKPSKNESAAPAMSPAVRRVIEENGLDPATITGTGANGRITKADAERAAKSTKTSVPPERAPATATGSAADGAPEPAPANRVHVAPSAATATSPATAAQRRVPLSNLRKRIAENLVHSRQSSAHVTTFAEVDMSRVIAIRTERRDQFQERFGVRLGFMSFFVKASQTALSEYPDVNAYLDNTDIVYNDAVNIGVALSSEKGLLTPVLKDVASKSFADIERQIVDFGERANNRRLMPDELVGATFTISNGGIFGSLMSTPIPSPPQTAVLGMHAIEKRPVVVDDEIVIRPMMYLALTYDHRMVDGREAVGFLGRIKELVQDPTRLLLGL
jgi:2-oxoglutarate dehydrogenase E2 component (dihydrolipoamide succinyltransferase)